MVMNNKERKEVDTLEEKVDRALTLLARIDERVKFQWWAIGGLVGAYGALLWKVATLSH